MVDCLKALAIFICIIEQRKRCLHKASNHHFGYGQKIYLLGLYFLPINLVVEHLKMAFHNGSVSSSNSCKFCPILQCYSHIDLPPTIVLFR